MEPSSWLMCKANSCSAERLLSDGGMIPVKLLISIMDFKLGKPPSQAEISPASYPTAEKNYDILSMSVRCTHKNGSLQFSGE
jgi:hypothetical protein